MGKTKTMFVEGQVDKKTGKEAYAEKMAKKAAAEAQLNGASVKKVEKVKEVKEKVAEPVSEQVETQELPQTVSEATVSDAPVKKFKLKVRSLNYKSARTKIDRNKNYTVPSALKLLKEISYSKFDPTVELHVTTKTSPLSANITLPHAGAKEKKIEIASEKTIEKLTKGVVDYDLLLATADMMPKLVPFARILGPKGLMPNPKNGTLIKSAKDADRFSGNTLTLKTQKDANAIHTVVGKLSHKESDLEDNIKAIVAGVGEKQIVKLFIKTTMSPSIKLSF
jgi:large subunit ribosomal protein L1